MFFMDEEYLKKAMDDILNLWIAKTEVHDLVDDYKRFLDDKYPKHVKSYCYRLKNHPEGAKAEAVVFSFLEANLDDVQVAEEMGIGGVDFRCKTDDAEFLAEVTCLEARSVTCQSGLPDDPSSGGHFDMITKPLRTKVSKKVNQMSSYSCPRILVIACQHTHANTVLGISGAEDLLTGETKIEIVPFGNPERDHLVADLENSVFFRWENGSVESCRNGISAILLFSISGRSAFIAGILHPDPIHKFPIEFLPSVPFVRLKEWPLADNRIGIEWAIHKPPEQEILEWKPERFWYDKDLRST